MIVKGQSVTDVTRTRGSWRTLAVASGIASPILAAKCLTLGIVWLQNNSQGPLEQGVGIARCYLTILEPPIAANFVLFG